MEPWHRLDNTGADEARRLLLTCCGSTRWADRMLTLRPFGNRQALVDAARDEWLRLDQRDWLEAFSHHPRIGDRTALGARFPATAHLSESEQTGVRAASDDLLDRLAQGNRAYEEKFGFIFIVCATGKSAEEMLALLEARLANTRDAELRIAAEEQAKITALRLERLG